MYLKTLSSSSYDLHSWCHWKFALQKELGFEDVSGPSAQLGTFIHHILELYSKASIVNHRKDSKIWNLNYLWKICFNRYYSRFLEQFEQIKPEKIKTCANGVIQLLNSPYSPISANTIGCEVKFSIPLKDKVFLNQDGESLNITGRIDRVDRIDNETIEIYDWKTGTRTSFSLPDRPKKDSILLSEEVQPRMYHLACKTLYPQYKNYIINFYYLTDGGSVQMILTDDDIPKTLDMIKRKFLAIKMDNNPDRNKTWKCNVMCPFSKNNICDDLWKEKNELGYDFLKQKYTVLNFRPKK